jgi:acetoacetate decarboxylase
MSLTIEGETDEGPRHNAPPIVTVRHFPRLAAGRHDDPQVHELVRAVSRDRAISKVVTGPATLTLHSAPGEEHDSLAPVEIDRGYRFTFGYTIDDLETVKELV